jgi:hypothetical protein
MSLNRGIAAVALACLAAVGGAVLLGTQPAEAAWTHYVNVVKQHDVKQPLVETDSAGDTVFAWLQGIDARDPAIYTRVRTAAGTFSPVQRIASVSGRYDLAVDPDGNAYYVWTARDSAGREQVRTRVRFADGTLSPMQTLKTVGKTDFIQATVGVDASGTAVYAWDQRPNDEGESDLLQARIRSPSGTLGDVYGIGEGYLLDWGRDADLAVDASGNATFTWTTGAVPDDGWVHVFTRVLAANGGLGPVTEVSRAGRPGTDGQVVVTPSGRAIFGWEEYDRDSGALNLLVRGRSADGNFQPPQVVAKTDDYQAASTLQLGIAPTGEAVIGWRTNHAWYARTRAPGGALGPRKTIAAIDVRDSDLGIDSQGNIVFAWTPWATDGGKGQVFARTESPGGALSPTRVLSLAGYNAYSPRVAVSPAGDAAIGWQEGFHGFAIQAAFGP